MQVPSGISWCGTVGGVHGDRAQLLQAVHRTHADPPGSPGRGGHQPPPSPSQGPQALHPALRVQTG